MKKLISIAGFVTALAAATPARAQAPGGPQTVLPNIINTATGATIEGSLDYTNVEDSDATLLGFKFQGQYITPAGYGIYGSLPFAYASVEDDDASGIGNLEIGGMYVMHNSPDLDLFGRGGLAIDTADDDAVGLAPLSFLVSRPAEAVQTGFATNWLRLHGGVRTKGALVFGAQGGFDLPTDGDFVDGVFTLTGAIGIVQPGFGLSAGLTYIKILQDDDGVSFVDDDTLGFNAVIDFNASPKAKVYGSFGLNLDEIDEALGFAIGGGIRLAL
jgi:hypothetical protein